MGITEITEGINNERALRLGPFESLPSLYTFSSLTSFEHYISEQQPHVRKRSSTTSVTATVLKRGLRLEPEINPGYKERNLFY